MIDEKRLKARMAALLKGIEKELPAMCKEIGARQRDMTVTLASTFMTIVKMVDDLAEKGCWIPIKFRETTDEDGFDKEEHPIMLECTLPDNGEEVLVSTKLGYVLEDTFYNDDGAYFESFEWDEITAWMPKPKPYKESE